MIANDAGTLPRITGDVGSARFVRVLRDSGSAMSLRSLDPDLLVDDALFLRRLGVDINSHSRFYPRASEERMSDN